MRHARSWRTAPRARPPPPPPPLTRLCACSMYSPAYFGKKDEDDASVPNDMDDDATPATVVPTLRAGEYVDTEQMTLAAARVSLASAPS